MDLLKNDTTVKKQALRSLWMAVVALLLGLSVVGCGSGSKSEPASSTGRATITVRWPDPEESRLIPVRANSIKVRLTDETSTLVGEAVLTRATPTATFNPLPVGNLTVVANAYPETNGTGVSQATATAPLIILADANTPITMTLASTITRLEITPATASFIAGTTQQFAATAKNSAGEVVLTSPTTIQWSVTAGGATSIGGGNAVTISTAGLLSILKPGASTLSVRETESNAQTSRALTVTTNIVVSISPENFTISPGRTIALTANLDNLPTGADSSVTWTTTGGAITQAGVFTAPATSGTVTVTATSKFDPSKSGMRTVTVKNGTINVEVD